MVLEFECNDGRDFLWKRSVDDEGCLTGVAGIAVDTAVHYGTERGRIETKPLLPFNMVKFYLV